MVIDPELEAWVWSDSPHVGAVLGWSSTPSDLRRTLVEAGHLDAGQIKPHRPKDAFDLILPLSKKRRSSALFLELAQKVSFESCKDPSFLKLKVTLQKWFGH